MHKNHEGYPDPTAGDAIREADRPRPGGDRVDLATGSQDGERISVRR